MIYPFPLIRNYRTSPGLTRLALRFANASDLEVIGEDHFYTTIQGGGETLKFWSSNKYYAWASAGEYTRHNGAKVAWRNEMPSRWAVRQLSKAVERARWGAA